MAVRAARTHHVTGEAEIVEDGTVRLICEGRKANIAKMFGSIQDEFGMGEIDWDKIGHVEPTGEFNGFGMKLRDHLVEISDGFGECAMRLRQIRTTQNVLIARMRDVVEGQRDVVEGQRDVVESQEQMMERMTDWMERMTDWMERMVEGQRDVARSMKNKWRT